MSEEPFYIRQTGEITTPEATRQWFNDAAEEAKKEGAILCRFSLDNAANPKMALVEGWNHEVRCQGEVRWQLTKSEGGQS